MEQVAIDLRAPTLQSLADLYLAHASDKKRRSSLRADRSYLSRLPVSFKAKKLAYVTRENIENLKRAMADTPIMFNRTLALLSAMFNHAIKQKLLTRDFEISFSDFPRFAEPQRKAPVDEEQVQRLYAALDAHRNQNACNVIRLLMWTGSSCSEMAGARWSEFDLTRGIWTKPPRA